MIKIDEIEIRHVNYKTLDNGACGVEVEWTTPEILPNIKFGYYSLSYQKYKEYCEKGSLWDWCRNVVFQNELLAIANYDRLINDIQPLKCPNPKPLRSMHATGWYGQNLGFVNEKDNIEMYGKSFKKEMRWNKISYIMFITFIALSITTTLSILIIHLVG